MNNREIAKQLGLRTYVGKPCKYGHTIRYTANRVCQQCSQVAARIHYIKNPILSEETKLKRKLYYQTHKEENVEAQRRYRKKNPGKVAAYQKAYRENNPDKYAKYYPKKGNNDGE